MNIYNHLILVKVNDTVKVDQPLTSDPNVGGFGQAEVEIILQDPLRVKGMIAFFFSIIIAQIFLVLKKKFRVKRIHSLPTKQNGVSTIRYQN